MKKTVKCAHNDDVSKCPPCWAEFTGDKPYTEDELRKCINAALKNLVDNAGKPDDKFLYRQCDIQTDAIMAAVAHAQPKQQHHAASVSVDEWMKSLEYERIEKPDGSVIYLHHSQYDVYEDLAKFFYKAVHQPPDHSGCLSREQKAYKRGYNTGFQKHKRINKRNAGVIVQLEAIVETLRSDDQLGLSGNQEKEGGRE